MKTNKPTQEERVLKELMIYKNVNNLWAIRNHIWRLGAIICELRKKGYTFEGSYLTNTKGKLTKIYNYKLIQK